MTMERPSFVRSVWNTTEHDWHYEWWTGKQWTHHETRISFFEWDEACEIANKQRAVTPLSGKRSCISVIRAHPVDYAASAK